MTLVRESAGEFLWLTDEFSGEVAKTTLDGETVVRLPPPDLPVYRETRFAPTWVAVHEESLGGNGDVWVADGYGAGLVHRYDRGGAYICALSGEEGEAGRFTCPHGIWLDHRKPEPELYIADRGNRRVQVYDTDGGYKRVFGDDLLHSPCGFARSGADVVVPELKARVDILDAEDRLVCSLGANEATCDVGGWPNHPPERLQPGRFNSPHAAAADDDGNLYVVEWIVGGRITKLVKQ